MKLNIASQEKNPFLEREELVVEITEEAMPTKEGILEALGKDKDLCVIKKINSNFGRGKFVADVTVYNTPEAKSKYMTIPKKVRAKMEADKKSAEEAAKKAEAEAAQAEEAPAVEPEVKAEEPAAEVPKEETPVEEVKKEAKE
jgi:ribosomal protein S24E